MIQVEHNPPFDRVFSWRNNERRRELYGRRCRVLAKGTTMNSVLIEFENGERTVTSQRALRRVTI